MAPPEDLIQLNVYPNPFGVRRITSFHEPGPTVLDHVAAAGINTDYHLKVTIDGDDLPSEKWATTEPERGQIVCLNVLPKGGRTGKVIFSLVLSIASLGLGAAGAGLFGPGLAQGLGVAGIGARGILGLVGAGVIGLYSGIRALTAPPPDKPKALESRALEDPVRLGGNSVAQNAPFVKVLGSPRFAPHYLVNPFTERKGDDVDVNVVYSLGIGPVEITEDEMWFGNIKVSQFRDEILEEPRIHKGYDDEPVEFLINSVSTESDVGKEYPFNIDPDDGPDPDGHIEEIVVAIPDESAEFSLNFLFPSGLRVATDGGNSRFAAVEFLVEFQPFENDPDIGAWHLASILNRHETLDELNEEGVYVGTPEKNRHYVKGSRTQFEFVPNQTPDRPANHVKLKDNSNWRDFRGFPESADVGVFRFAGVNESPTRRQLRFILPEPGSGDPGESASQRYRARVTRTRIDWHVQWFKGEGSSVYTPTDGDIQDGPVAKFGDCILRSVQGFSKREAPNVPNLAWVEFRLRNSEDIAGVLGRFTCRPTSVLPFYADHSGGGESWGPDTREIGDVYPANPNGHIKRTDELRDQSHPSTDRDDSFSMCFAEVLRGRMRKRAVPDTRVDSQSLVDWATANTHSGTYEDPHRSCHILVSEQTRAFDLLRNLASAGRAMFTKTDGIYGVVPEVSRGSTIVAVLSASNVRDLSVTRVHQDQVEGLKIQFIDEGRDGELHTEQEIEIAAPGFYVDGEQPGGKTLATEFGRLPLLGAMNSSAAKREGRWHLASGLSQRAVYKWAMDIERLVFTRGDRVVLNHHVIRTGLGSARVKAITLNGMTVEDVTIDQVVEPASNVGQLGARIRLSDNTTIVGPCTAGPGDETQILRFTPALSYPGPTVPAVGDMVLWGESGSEDRDVLIQSVRRLGDLGASVEAVDYVESIYDADIENFEVPAPGVTIPVPLPLRTPSRPRITRIRSDESVLKRKPDGSLLPQIVVQYELDSQLDQDRPASFVEVQWRLAPPTQGPWKRGVRVESNSTEVAISDVVVGLGYVIRLRSVSTEGYASEWRYVVHWVVGGSTEPPAVSDLRVEGQEILTWDYEPPVDHRGFRIRYATTTRWEDGIPLGSGFATETVFRIGPGVLPPGDWNLMVRAEDVFGNQSALTLTERSVPVEFQEVVKATFTQTTFNFTTDAIIGGTASGGGADQYPVSADLITGAGEFYGVNPDALYYQNGGSELYYDERTQYEAMEIIIQGTHGAALFPARLVLEHTNTQGIYRVLWNEAAFGTEPSRRWPGFADLEAPALPLNVQFRIVYDGGHVQGIAAGDTWKLLAIMKQRRYSNVAMVNAPAGTPLPVAVGEFAVITHIDATVHQGAGATGTAVVAYALDHALPAAGPLMAAATPAGVNVNDNIDATVTGYL